jgi:LAO/AO transport system kinase
MRSIRHFRALSSTIKRTLSKSESLSNGILSENRASLAKAITLIESSREDHQRDAEDLMKRLSSARSTDTNNDSFSSSSRPTLRVGIAGPPGAGKSTFIEKLGLHYLSEGHKVAVIAVDPSSHISGGSILGDKTRMDQLSIAEGAFVRASPTRGVLGGIAEHTSDVVFLCESGGFDVVIVESVGLGQSEVEISNAVDLLLLLVPPGGGDDLQASKKGIMEAADVIVVNKADGDFLTRAKHTKADYAGQIAFIRQQNPNWRCRVHMMSNHTSYGFKDVVGTIKDYMDIMIDTGGLEQRRSGQSEHWMWTHLQRHVLALLKQDITVKSQAKVLTPRVSLGSLSSRVAARKLSELFLQR